MSKKTQIRDLRDLKYAKPEIYDPLFLFLKNLSINLEDFTLQNLIIKLNTNTLKESYKVILEKDGKRFISLVTPLNSEVTSVRIESLLELC